MPEDFNSAIVTAQGTLYDIRPWVFLYDAYTDDPNRIYVAGHDEIVQFEGQQYLPYPIRYELLSADATSRLTGTTIAVANIGGFIVGKLKNREFLDREARVHLVKETDKGIEKAWTKTFKIRNASVSSDLVAFECGQENLLSLDFPAQRFTRNKCWHGVTYGGKGCNFDTTMPIPPGFLITYPDFDITTCDLTRDGGNGCVVHGECEAQNGKPRLHPLLAGFFPAIPMGPARV